MSRGAERQIPVISFFARHGYDFAPKFKNRARSGWRERGRPDPFRALRPTGSSFHEIRRHAQSDLLCLSARGIEQVNIAALFIGNLSTARSGVHDRKIGVLRQAPDRLLSRIEGVYVELAVAIRPEVKGVPDPHR